MSGPTADKPFRRLIARWDLDKTYLHTDFDTLQDLLRTALERPDRKRSVPGASAVLRELSRTGARIHILSGSPRQLRGRLEEKLLLDRVEFDELTLKPNLSNMLRFRFRALKDQLGYKLPALLAARIRDQGQAPEAPPAETLVGDDAEADAFVYSLYADLCHGEIAEQELGDILDAGQLFPDQARAIQERVQLLRRCPTVKRILIHLDRQTPPSRFTNYGERLVPFYNYMQAAFVLMEDGYLSAEQTLRVAEDLVRFHRFDGDALAHSYTDLARRGHVIGGIGARLKPHLSAAPTTAAVTKELEWMCERTSGPERLARSPAPGPRHLDYRALAWRHRGGRAR